MVRQRRRVTGHKGWLVWGKKSPKPSVNTRQLGKMKKTKAEANKLQTKYRKKGFVAYVVPSY